MTRRSRARRSDGLGAPAEARSVTTDEFWGQGDATEAGDGLIALRDMLRVGRQSVQRPYCWCYA